MTLTFARCEEMIRHTLGRSPSSEVGANLIINQAGEYLAGCHPWKWLVRPPVDVDLRGTISFTGATWTNATLRITKTGAFADYTWKAGDRVLITSGTNATAGYYRVASKVSNDAIALTATIGAGADGQTNIAGSLEFPWIVLPTDFGACLQIEGKNTAADITLTTYKDVMQRRSVGLSGEAHTYRGVFLYREPFTDLTPPESAPVPRLELDRSPASNSSAAFVLTYRAGWARQADDANFALMPTWIEMLYLRMLRAIARGYEEEDEQDVDTRLVSVLVGPAMVAAKRQDAMIQRSYGMTGAGEIGAAQVYTEEGDGWLSSPVAAPSTL